MIQKHSSRALRSPNRRKNKEEEEKDYLEDQELVIFVSCPTAATLVYNSISVRQVYKTAPTPSPHQVMFMLIVT